MIAGDVGGRSALALRLVLAAVSNRLSDSAGVPTGEEVSLTDDLMTYKLPIPSIPYIWTSSISSIIATDFGTKT